MNMLTITDASFGNESNFRSQKGRMTFLTGPDSFDKNGMGVCMVADCLTKRMRSDRLSCWLDLIPTDEYVLCKMKKQKGRTNPGGSAGDLDRNDHFDQWRSYMKKLPAE